MKQLIIDRKRWLRGGDGGGYSSYLFRDEDKKMCCLGFWCRSRGLSIDRIRDISSPIEVLNNFDRKDQTKTKTKTISLLSPLLTKNADNDNKICSLLMINNDNNKISEEERERRIGRDFAKIGIKVKFIN